MHTEEQIKDFFRSAPEEITSVPIFATEDQRFFAYGHVEPHEMVLAIIDLDLYNNCEDSSVKPNPEDMQYHYAKVVLVDGNHDEVAFMTCTPTDEDAFPVTTWCY